MPEEYRAKFLWPFDEGTVEEAGYEFANAHTEEHSKLWWETLQIRMAQKLLREIFGSNEEE